MIIEDKKLIKVEPDDMSENGKFVVPDGIEVIGCNAFSKIKVSLREIIVSKDVKIIGTSTFINCETLEKIVLPDGIETIGTHAFYHCTSLKSIDIPDSLIDLGKEAFLGSGLESIKIPPVTTVKTGTFKKCKALSEVTFSEKAPTIIGESAFEGCDIKGTLRIPDGVKQIMIRAFANNPNLQKIVIPNSVIEIERNTAYNNNIELEFKSAKTAFYTTQASPGYRYCVSFNGKRYNIINGINHREDYIAVLIEGYVRTPKPETSICFGRPMPTKCFVKELEDIDSETVYVVDKGGEKASLDIGRTLEEAIDIIRKEELM